jgi:SMC interacting uncharacterized protein involved in chromosome segregation
MVKQNVHKALKKFQDNKNKYEKTQKQIIESIGALNKHQNETENTINRDINGLRTKTDNIKEKVTHDMENLRKRNETEYKPKWKAIPADKNKQKRESLHNSQVMETTKMPHY